MDEHVERNAEPESSKQDTAEATSSLDTMVEQSFPASDPPAVWTWDVSDPRDRARSDG